MNIFRKRFAAKETKKVLAALNLLESRFADCIFMFETVKERAEQLTLNDQNRLIHAINVLNVTPENAALVYIMETAYNCLLSGDYHIRRGVLLDSGREVLKISDTAMKMLIANGHMRQDEVDKYRADISEAIAGSG